MREATENTSAGITIGGRKINNLRYANDTTLLCESKEDLMELLTRIQHLSKEKGLLLNTRQTKIMVVYKNRTDDQKFILNGEELEEVKSFVYLGSLINTEVSCMPEVNRRLCMARSTIENMTTIWKSQAICRSLKLRIARATAFAVATYGCESWAYSKKVTKKIEAFDMWTYRRLLRLSWRQHNTNAWILEQLRTKPMLVKQMRKRKMKHFGHIIRHNSLEKTIIQGITTGKIGRGRPSRTWGKNIEEWARANIGEATRMAERRDLWCTVIDVTAAQPWAIWTDREREADDMQLDVCGLSETHWIQSGEMTIGEHIVITSSDQNRNYQGVGLIISKNLRKSVMSYNAVSSRIVTIRIKARPANMSIIQIYASTLDKDDEVHDEFYEQLQVTIASIKRSDYLIVMGDFNAILGNEKVPCVTGAHGTGIRNNSGQRLLEFCSANDLFVTNTGFRHHLRRKTTWISPDGRTKNEIDYIMIRSRFKSSALNCRAYPKAEQPFVKCGGM